MKVRYVYGLEVADVSVSFCCLMYFIFYPAKLVLLYALTRAVMKVARLWVMESNRCAV